MIASFHGAFIGPVNLVFPFHYSHICAHSLDDDHMRATVLWYLIVEPINLGRFLSTKELQAIFLIKNHFPNVNYSCSEQNPDPHLGANSKNTFLGSILPQFFCLFPFFSSLAWKTLKSAEKLDFVFGAHSTQMLEEIAAVSTFLSVCVM